MASNLGYVDRLGSVAQTFEEEVKSWGLKYMPLTRKAIQASKSSDPVEIERLIAEIQPAYIALDEEFRTKSPKIYNSGIGNQLRANVELNAGRAIGKLRILKKMQMDKYAQPLPDGPGPVIDDPNTPNGFPVEDEGFEIPWLPIGLAAGAIGLVFAFKG